MRLLPIPIRPHKPPAMSLDHCERLFRDVRRCGSLPEICHALEPIFDRYKVVSLGLERGAVFWRARPCKDTPWPSLTDMGAPPTGVASAGRFNDPSQSLLYTSIREETALLEINSLVGQTVQVIGYRTILGENIRLAVVGELMHVYKLGYMRFTGSDPGLTISRLVNDLGASQGREVIFFDAFLNSLLADDGAKGNEYIVTRAVASMIFRDQELDGIAFQSTRDTLGYNVILRPEAAAKKIHATSCFQCQIKAIREYNFIDYEVLSEVVRLREDNAFEWAQPLGVQRRRFFNLTKEEYDVARSLANDPNAFLAMTRAHR